MDENQNELELVESDSDPELSPPGELAQCHQADLEQQADLDQLDGLPRKQAGNAEKVTLQCLWAGFFIHATLPACTLVRSTASRQGVQDQSLSFSH